MISDIFQIIYIHYLMRTSTNESLRMKGIEKILLINLADIDAFSECMSIMSDFQEAFEIKRWESRFKCRKAYEV